jgi:hypothetical protein
MSDYDDFDDLADDFGVAQSTYMRTFRVVLEGRPDVVLQAISYATELDTAKFYRLDDVVIDGVPTALQVNHRCLRPFVDVEDITHQTVPQPESVN